jgi:uncharacterized protein RhaS with RHS repeats
MDPIGLAGGLNVYGYANGDPITFSDPFGLSADTLDAVQVDHLSSESPTKASRQLCVDRSVASNVQTIFNSAVAAGIPVTFNNAYRDRVTPGTGGRPSGGTNSRHLAGFAFDINSSALTPGQLQAFTAIAVQNGFSPLRGDPGHFSADPLGAYSSFSAAVTEAQRSYGAGECVDQQVDSVRR